MSSSEQLPHLSFLLTLCILPRRLEFLLQHLPPQPRLLFWNRFLYLSTYRVSPFALSISFHKRLISPRHSSLSWHFNDYHHHSPRYRSQNQEVIHCFSSFTILHLILLLLSPKYLWNSLTFFCHFPTITVAWEDATASHISSHSFLHQASSPADGTLPWGTWIIPIYKGFCHG